MLVYANHLTLEGPGAPDAIFRAVGGWLKEHMGRGLHPMKLKSDGKYDGKKRDGIPSTLRIYTASENEIEYYAWVLKHPDKEDRGRQWITEIGVESGSEKLEISFVVRTEEISARVEPPSVSRPRVVQYVVENIKKANDASFSEKSIPVYKTKEIGEDSYSYRALLFDIEKKDRRYPIVLVSPTTEGGYLLDADYLQEKLIGLAQVVRIIPNFTLNEMEEILGKFRSACAGAINILYAPDRFGYSRIRLCSADDMNTWNYLPDNRASEVLSLITHETNSSYFQLRVRPEKIAQRSMRQRSERLLLESTERIIVYKEKIKKAIGDIDEYIEIADNFSKELEDINSEHEEKIKQIISDRDLYMEMADNSSKEVDGLASDLELKEREVDDLKDDNHKKANTIEYLEDRLKNEKFNKTMSDNIDVLVEILHKDKIAPSMCLDIIGKHYGDKCVVLEEAKDSAKDSIFDDGRKLMSQLIRLVTKYREILVNGGSDDDAKKEVFGSKEFSAKESEATIGKKKNTKLANKRKFIYDGEEILMERHLKIGNADDKKKTIRTHFHWDRKKKIIVIGYCGIHLPVSNKKN